MSTPKALAALQFDSALRAGEFVSAAIRMQSEGHLLVHDAVFVTKDADNTTYVTETTDLTTGQGALGGALWGGLFGVLLAAPIAGLAIGAGLGALRGKLVDVGVDNAFIDAMGTAAAPGKTVLVMLVSHVDEQAVLEELERFPGVELLASDLPTEAVAIVEAALAQPTR